MQDSSDEICLTSDIDFGEEEKEEEKEETKHQNTDELIIKNMQYDLHSDAPIKTTNLWNLKIKTLKIMILVS